MNTTKRKPGPKTERGAEPMDRRTITVDEMTWRKLVVLGDGNASKGVRIGADIGFEQYQRGVGPWAKPRAA